jgi:hypothetical protein
MYFCRVKGPGGSEHTYKDVALKVYSRHSRAVTMLIESVYFPALAAMLFQACETNPGIKTVLLRQATAFAMLLRPLEMYRETSSREMLQHVWKVDYLHSFLSFRDDDRALNACHLAYNLPTH